MKAVRITEQEHVHLINASGPGRTITTTFGPGGAYVTAQTEEWVVLEIARLRGVVVETAHTMESAE